MKITRLLKILVEMNKDESFIDSLFTDPNISLLILKMVKPLENKTRMRIRDCGGLVQALGLLDTDETRIKVPAPVYDLLTDESNLTLLNSMIPLNQVVGPVPLQIAARMARADDLSLHNTPDVPIAALARFVSDIAFELLEKDD